jgi:hypothetical protein
MMIEEQENLKRDAYRKAMSNMVLARTLLDRTTKQFDSFYIGDTLCEASKTAYEAVLTAIDAWLLLQGGEIPVCRPTKNRIYQYDRDWEKYRAAIRSHENILELGFSEVFLALMLHGCNCEEKGRPRREERYQSFITTTERGMILAQEIIDRIKPQGAL